MNHSDGKTSNRRSQRLFKGLDLADSIKKTQKETLYDSLNAKPCTIVSKLHKNIRNSKPLQIQQVHSNETDDDCIVISSDDESTDHKSVTSTETVSEIIIQYDSVNNINPVVIAVETIDEPIVIESVPKQPDIIETIVESPKQSIQIEINPIIDCFLPLTETFPIIDNKPAEEMVIDSEPIIELNNQIETNEPVVEQIDFIEAQNIKETIQTPIQINEPEEAARSVRVMQCVMIPQLEVNLASSKLKPTESDDSDDDDEVIKPKKNTQIIQSSSSEVDSEPEKESLIPKVKWCVCAKSWPGPDMRYIKMCDNGKCGQWYHPACLGYTEEQINQMKNKKKTEQSMKFICPVCENDQLFIKKYKKEIEYRRNKFSVKTISSNDEEEDEEEDDDKSEAESDRTESDESSSTEKETTKRTIRPAASASLVQIDKQINKQKKLVSELSEHNQREKIDKLKKSQKPPNQTKLIDTPLEKITRRHVITTNIPITKKPYTSSSFKSIIDKSTPLKEQSKIATTAGFVKIPTIKPPLQIINSKQCQYCKKQLNPIRTVPSKIAQDLLFENDDLKANWSSSIYCDEKCITNYIETELSKREKHLHELSKDSPFYEIKRKNICLLDYVTKSRYSYFSAVNNNLLKKELYNKISKSPRLFIAELNYLEHLLNTNLIPKPNTTISQKSTISSSIATNQAYKVQRSISTTPKTINQEAPKLSKHISDQPEDLRSGFKINLIKTLNILIKENSDKFEPDQLEELVSNIELSFHNFFNNDTNRYRNKAASIISNLKRKPYDFYYKILSGQIKPTELPNIDPKLMKSDEEAKKAEQAKKEEFELIQKHNDEVNLSKMGRIRKTHKGEEYIEYDVDVNAYTDRDDTTTETNKEKEEITPELSNTVETVAPKITTPPPLSPLYSLSTTSISNKPLVARTSISNSSIYPISLKKTDSSTFLAASKSIFAATSTQLSDKNQVEKANKRRHDPDFESEDEEDQSKKTNNVFKPIEKSKINIAPPKPVNIESKKVDYTRSISTPLSINVPKANQIPITDSKTPNSVIESIQFDSNLNYIAPHSPTITTENLINADISHWNRQLVLKSAEDKTAVKANLLPTLTYERHTEYFEKNLIRKLKAELKLEFTFKAKRAVYQPSDHRNTFWNYLTRIKKNLSVPILFFALEQNGSECNSLLIQKDDPKKCSPIADYQAFILFTNRLDNAEVWEYNIPDELKTTIGYFYVAIVKAKPDPSLASLKWFPENLSINIDRSKQIILGIFIDYESKVKYSLPPDFLNEKITSNKPLTEENSKRKSNEPLESAEIKKKITEEATTSNKAKTSVTTTIKVNRDPRLQRQQSTKTHDSNKSEVVSSDSPKEQPDSQNVSQLGLNSQSISQLVPPLPPSLPVSKLTTVTQLDPLSVSKFHTQPVPQPSSTLTLQPSSPLVLQPSSTLTLQPASPLVLQPTVPLATKPAPTTFIKPALPAVSLSVPPPVPQPVPPPAQKPVPSPFLEPVSQPDPQPAHNDLYKVKSNENEPTKSNQPIKFDIVNHIESILNKLDRYNKVSCETELCNFYSLPERKLLTSNDKKYLTDKYSPTFPDFVILINTDQGLPTTSEVNNCEELIERELPPANLWQGESKESFENLVELHKDYHKNKNIKNFNFENENWYLSQASFNVQPLDLGDDVEDENETKISNDSNRKVDYRSQYSERASRYDDSNNYNKSNYYNSSRGNKRKSRSRSRSNGGNKRDSKYSRSDRE